MKCNSRFPISRLVTICYIPVELIHFDFKKLYKIAFDLECFHKDTKYKSKSIIYGEYISPNFLRIIDNYEIKN